MSDDSPDAAPDAPHVTALPSRLDSDAAPDLLETLRNARGRALILEGEKVTFLGGKCLLTLLSARKAWEEDGYAFTLRSPSEALSQGAVDMGADLSEFSQEPA